MKTLPPVEMKEVKDFAEFMKERKRPAAKKSFTEFYGIIDKKDVEIMKASIEQENRDSDRFRKTGTATV